MSNEAMLQVVKVCRLGGVHARVLLDDGRKAKVPLALSSEGTVFPATDIIDQLVSGKVDWVHIQLKHEKRKPKILASVRAAPVSVAEQNKRAQDDYNIVKACVLKFHKGIASRRIGYDELLDLTSDIYVHFIQRGFFEGYDPNKSAYSTWVFKAVKNYIITMWRSRDRQFQMSMARLDQEFDSEDGDAGTMYDVVKDSSLISAEENAMRAEIQDRFRELAVDLDAAMLFEDGLPSYFDIYAALRDNVFDDLLDNYVGQFRRKQFMDKYQNFKQSASRIYATEMV